MELQFMKEIIKKQGEEPKFINRRMQEYNQLVKKPVYSETLIRVKLPENWVFECKFAPMETLQSLVEVFQEVNILTYSPFKIKTQTTTCT